MTPNCFHPGLVATGFNRNNGLLMDLGMFCRTAKWYRRVHKRTHFEHAGKVPGVIHGKGVQYIGFLMVASRRVSI